MQYKVYFLQTNNNNDNYSNENKQNSSNTPRDQGLVQAPRPNAGRRENDFFSGGKKNYLKLFFFAYIFQLCQNIGGNKFSRTGDSPKWVKSRRRRKKRRKKVGENNGKLPFRTQTHAYDWVWLYNQHYHRSGIILLKTFFPFSTDGPLAGYL